MHVKFIAEVSSNHHQSLDRCFQFIDEAARIGCDGVKFQLFKIDELFAPEVFISKPDVEKRRQWELPVSFLPELSMQCRKKEIMFSCTPFYLSAVDELFPYVDFYKIASYELLWDDLLKTCANTGKPIVLSTGMATMPEIKHAVNVILNAMPRTTYLPPLTLLHCVSGYPAPPDQCNLAAIQTLRNAFTVGANTHTSSPSYPYTIDIGWSDHSVSPEVIRRAVYKWEASMVEFHLDLEGEGEEFGPGHCWLPEQMLAVIREVQSLKSDIRTPSIDPAPGTSELGFDIDGTGEKKPTSVELLDIDWRADPVDGLRPLRDKRALLK